MAAPGLPDWLQRPWYRFNHAFIFASGTLGFSFRFEGVRHMPRRGPVLVVANHQCFLDPVLVGLAVTRTLHYMAQVPVLQPRAGRLPPHRQRPPGR